MSRIAELGAVLDALEHLEHLGLDGDVEGGGGLVGDQHVGLVGDRHGDHGPLAHAARVLVRVLVGPRRRVGDADEVEQLDHPLLQLVAWRTSWWTVIASAIWSPTCEHRVQRGERVLEDHGDAARPAAAAARFSLRPSDALARGSRTSPVTFAGLGSSPGSPATSRSCPSPTRRRCRASRSRSTSKRHAVDRLDHAVVGGELDAQVAHREQRRRRPAGVAAAGSSSIDRGRASVTASAPGLRVEGVAQAVAEEVDAQHGEQDGQAGEVDR